MKYLFIILCLFAWFRPAPFELLKADFQSSVGGRVESGITHTYTFSVVAKYGSDRMTVNHLWVDTTYFKVQPYKQNADLSFSQTWEKGDTLFIKAFKRHFPSGIKNYKDFNGNYLPVPKKYKGAALIEYELKGKKRFFEVDSIQKLPKVLLP